MKHRLAAVGGFTLIETVISLAVFTMIVLIFATSIPLAEKSAHMNGQYAQATSLCQHKIDQLRAVGWGRLTYTELSDAGIIDDNPSNLPFSFTEVDKVADYLPEPTGTVDIQDAGPKAVKVTVTITWKTAAHESKTSTMSLPALIANAE